MKLVIRKPDMDTALTALVLGCAPSDSILEVHDNAPRSLLDDPAVICIECGGAGEVERGNFDHHDTDMSLPSACIQTLCRQGVDDQALVTLARYVQWVDTGRGAWPGVAARPGLSWVFSGMRLARRGAREQLFAGMDIFGRVLHERLDPWGAMPCFADWRTYFEAKRRQGEVLARLRDEAIHFRTDSGLPGGCLEAALPGVHGLLRGLGCRVTIAIGLTDDGAGAGRYCTVAGKEIAVNPILPALQQREPGWGGPSHGGIIASPGTGTRLNTKELIELVCVGI